MAFEDMGGGVIALHLIPPGELKGRCFYYLKIRPGSLGEKECWKEKTIHFTIYSLW